MKFIGPRQGVRERDEDADRTARCRPPTVWSTAPEPDTWHGRTDAPFRKLPAGVDLLVEAAEPFRLHFGFDGWQQVADRDPQALGSISSACGWRGTNSRSTASPT
jgi:hypothetical protein